MTAILCDADHAGYRKDGAADLEGHRLAPGDPLECTLFPRCGLVDTMRLQYAPA